MAIEKRAFLYWAPPAIARQRIYRLKKKQWSWTHGYGKTNPFQDFDLDSITLPDLSAKELRVTTEYVEITSTFELLGQR